MLSKLLASLPSIANRIDAKSEDEMREHSLHILRCPTGSAAADLGTHLWRRVRATANASSAVIFEFGIQRRGHTTPPSRQRPSPLTALQDLLDLLFGDRQLIDVLPQPPRKIRFDRRGPAGVDLARRVFALT